MIAAVKEDFATAAPNEPDDHGGGDFFAFWSAPNEADNFIFPMKRSELAEWSIRAWELSRERKQAGRAEELTQLEKEV